MSHLMIPLSIAFFGDFLFYLNAPMVPHSTLNSVAILQKTETFTSFYETYLWFRPRSHFSLHVFRNLPRLLSDWSYFYCLYIILNGCSFFLLICGSSIVIFYTFSPITCQIRKVFTFHLHAPIPQGLVILNIIFTW